MTTVIEVPTVRDATEWDRARWNGYVEHHPAGSVYHRWDWRNVFANAYGTPSRYLVAERGRRVVGVLPLSRLSAPVFGTQLVAVPWFGHGGAIADDDEAYRALFSKARALLPEMGAKRAELRHAHAVPTDLLVERGDKVLMRLALPDSEEELLKSVGPKARADIRRPEKEGMTSHLGGAELIPDFHRAYAAVMRDLGSPCHAESLFARTYEEMPERCYVAVVRYQGRPIAGGFLIGMGDTVEIPCAGALHGFSRLRGNMLLYWAVISEAIRRGYKTFSFGRSSLDSGTFAFKKNWGAVPHPLPYHYVLREGDAMPEHKPGGGGALAKVVAAWQRLPVPVATTLGPRLVKGIP